MIARAVAAMLVLVSPVHADPQPAVADLMHYASDLPNCLSAAPDPQTAAACVGAASTACMETEDDGFSTVGMMFCTLAEYHAWDAELNAAYQAARADMAQLDAQEQELFAEFATRADSLRTAQRAWITFRDAECALAYALWGAGSMRQIAGASCLLDMTATRTVELRFLGDVMR
ncbi:lysozyme inhibitor LprI family protein [Pseudooctadecabacter jejudonensis]|uniref:Lysozyme inhibitor LprI-like N-terminal domain-containing protein n=1 Tax=Pseudooctadecabacter jejudonensis TaxID=1391910 RepID=A0A1Y5T941_9RHOB|nr:lysozyme inhibitor LprI family protein [Pseudooctadecabacter jejudonensis]SLN58196.1 hypothetical protein PSJ8397_03055 [Pseudooctadecabacter jejudonensis]